MSNGIKISRRAADRVRAGHLWIYRSDVAEGTAEQAALDAGALVTVTDSRGIPLGTATWSSASEIALRIVSRRPGLTRADYLVELSERVAAAIRLRQELAPEVFAADGATDACRLIFSEADGLPGIVADRYGELVVVQLLTQGTAQADVRTVLAEAFSMYPWVHTVVERTDSRVRELEQLAAAPEEPIFIRSGTHSGNDATSDLATVFSLNGLQLRFDAAGQKTGAFLDQRLNYAAAARYARGRGLDICTYQGGFALHLARACERVTGVDVSRAALEVADRNLEMNASVLSGAKVDWIEADAFDLLRDFDSAGERFGTIVLDPPAFAKSKRAAEGALRGYKELNLRALRMIEPGGTLVTCSCSHHVGLADFMEVVRSAAADAGRRVQLLEIRGAAPDHSAVLTLPETSYLKCLICRVD